ncbi:type II secretion system F family protein [Salinisphaera sp.]|uniref:type II secretion system F family protein n=1 Tax=Salinisphaera sp. TaxID=1914330 RepID=UPI002D78ECEF|nr:type II secretion system F family protein [Salinisphaera sp.]HET7314082.1 type II secretion system F family protein [Salinisphaera sp.]
MFDALMPNLLGLLAVAAALLLFAALWAFRSSVRSADRTYMDPLSWQVRLIWPLAVFVAHYFGRVLSTEYIHRTYIRLQRAGWSFHVTPEEFFGLRVVSAVGALLLGAFGLWLVGRPYWLLLIVSAALGFMLPSVKLNESRKKREREIIRSLPTYLDFIVMAVEAGLSLAGALVQATVNGPEGLFRHELERVNRDIKAGAGRIEALEGMAERLDLREVTGVVSALSQADKTGGDIGHTLRIQADQQRIDRFQRAEKLAMEAPVKLIFPLVAFIFPTTFIVLAFPIVMKLIHGV